MPQKGTHISRETGYTEAEVQALLRRSQSEFAPAKMFEAMKPMMLDFFLPVGTVIECVDNVHPKDKYGGEWEQIKDVFTLAAGDTYAAGSTGGEAEHYHSTQGHTLTVNEIPSHNHEPLDSRAFVTTDRSHTPNRTSVASGSGASGMLHSDIGLVRQNNTAARGGGDSHSHGDTGSASSLPPYLVVYKWKRVA